jgi:protein involved in polysaccharide export with SLBB domain
MAIHLAALLLMLAGSHQPATSQPAPPRPARETASYVIVPQDQLAISVYDAPDLTNHYRSTMQGSSASR